MPTLITQKMLPQNIIEIEDKFRDFCLEVHSFDTTAFQPSINYNALFPTVTNIEVDGNTGFVEISTEFLTEIIRDNSYGYTTSTAPSYYIDQKGHIKDVREKQTMRDRRYYYFHMRFDNLGRLKNARILDGTKNELFGLHIGIHQYLICGKWYDKEGFDEKGFQASTVEKREPFDLTFVWELLNDLFGL